MKSKMTDEELNKAIGNRTFKELICTKCGHNILEDKYKWENKTYRRKVTEYKLVRASETNRLLTKVIRLIKENVPSDAEIRKEYFFFKRIEKIPDNVVKIGIHRFLERNYHYDGKGFMYLSTIIQYTETNSTRQYELEQLKLGKLPKPQRKEDIDG